MKYIFLADDDADDRMLFEDALEQVSIPTQLHALKDGLELMEELETVLAPPPPDVIFLDLNMPRKNGFECLQEIRNTDKLKDIPVIMFSTSESPDSIDRTYKDGANLYICKPRSFSLLVKTIERVLSQDMWNEPQPPKEKFVFAVA